MQLLNERSLEKWSQKSRPAIWQFSVTWHLETPDTEKCNFLYLLSALVQNLCDLSSRPITAPAFCITQTLKSNFKVSQGF